MTLEQQRLYSHGYRSVILWRNGKGQREERTRPQASSRCTVSRIKWKKPHFRFGYILVNGRACPGHWLFPVSHPVLTPHPPHVFLPPTGKHLINGDVPLWVILLANGLFQGPLRGNDHSKRVLSLKQKSEWKANPKFQSIHPTHALKLGQRRRYFTGFYFVSKGRFEEEKGERGVYCSLICLSLLPIQTHF